LAVLAEVSVSLGLRGLVQCHKNGERMFGIHRDRRGDKGGTTVVI
jgi:hypothetical protein